MTLKEIRKSYHVSCVTLGMLNGVTDFSIRLIENKNIRDLTFKDLDRYATGLSLSLNALIFALLGEMLDSAVLKGGFYERHFNGSINVTTTFKSLEGCSNKPNIATLRKYVKEKDYYSGVKLNWCYFKKYGKTNQKTN